MIRVAVSSWSFSYLPFWPWLVLHSRCFPCTEQCLQRVGTLWLIQSHIIWWKHYSNDEVPTLKAYEFAEVPSLLTKYGSKLNTPRTSILVFFSKSSLWTSYCAVFSLFCLYGIKRNAVVLKVFSNEYCHNYIL